MLKYECYFTTDVGKVRTNNEDNFYLHGTYKKDTAQHGFAHGAVCDGGVFAVCDGMGGQDMGEAASLCAVETLLEHGDIHITDKAGVYIHTANEAVCRIAHTGTARPGTTLVLMTLRKNKVNCFNVGDSRGYMWRGGQMVQLTRDHSRVAQMLEMGLITHEEALYHPDRHAITQYIGIDSNEMLIDPYSCGTVKVKAGDIFLLASDGLTDMVSDDDILTILSEGADARDTALRLQSVALENGGRDNITVGIIKAYRTPNLFDRLFGRK